MAGAAPLDPALIRRKLGRAQTVAIFNGAMFGLSVPIALISALFDPISGLIATALLAGFTTVEFMGAGGLKRRDPRWPARLAANQMAVALVVSVYCLWQMLAPVKLSPELASNLPADFDPKELEQLARTVTVLAYSLVGLITLILCGANALYYRTRLKWIEAANAPPPPSPPPVPQA